jgi:hypothetical protein
VNQRLKKTLKGMRLWTAHLRHPWRELQRTVELGVWKALEKGQAVSPMDQGETTVLLDHLVRELVRLQQQIEVLQESVDQLATDQANPAIADKIEPAPEWRLTTGHLQAG